ncbi:MAG: RsmB/NOP family class I SAM-dependent RNA methyltransferase [Sporolactobacillus sp.]
MPLPDLFIKKMTHLLGAAEAGVFFSSYDKPRHFGLRVNTLKTTAHDFVQLFPQPLQPVAFCSNGFYYSAEARPGTHPFHQAGLYYIQEPSAMYAADCLDAQPGECVLDLCAAPGGKATQLAAAMSNQGLLVVNEIFPKRAKILSENIERCGVRHALVTNDAPETLAACFPNFFDKILIDAPCSGEGMFRKDPQAANYWSPAHVEDCAQLQATILEQAYRLLKPGGTLVYATCTFSPEENEQTIERTLLAHPDLSVVPLKKKGGIADGRPEWSLSGRDDLTYAARLWPHRLAGEGHFVCKLTKEEQIINCKAAPKMFKNSAAPPGDYRAFEQETLHQPIDGSFWLSGSQLYLLPSHCPDFRRLHVLRAGLHLGTLKTNRFEPNHALALALSSGDFIRTEALNSERCARYLRGEALPGSEATKGWCVATLSGFPLGWMKSSGGLLKNGYPKGLRRRIVDELITE